MGGWKPIRGHESGPLAAARTPYHVGALKKAISGGSWHQQQDAWSRYRNEVE